MADTTFTQGAQVTTHLPSLMSYADLQAESGVSEHTWRRKVTSGELPSCRVGSRRLVRREAWETYLRDLERASTPSRAAS